MRNSAGDPAVTSSAHDPDEVAGEDVSAWVRESWGVATAAERSALAFADETEGATSATDFVEDTDLSARVLLVSQYRLATAQTRRLEAVEWGLAETGPGSHHTTHPAGDGIADVDLQFADEYDDGGCSSEPGGGIGATIVRLPTAIPAVGSVGVQAGCRSD